MENKQVAAVFEEIADLLELQGGNPFRVRSYRNAAQSVGNLSERLEDIAEKEQLLEIPDIGESTAEKIREILKTGSCKRLKDLRKKVPRGLPELLHVPKLGPRKAAQLHDELGINTLRQLEKACGEKEVRELDGMGPKTEENILKGLRMLKKTEGRMRIDEAAEQLAPLGETLDQLKSVKQWMTAGSFRRGRETIGDLDILLQSEDRKKTTEKLTEYREVDEVIDRGKEKLSIRLKGGLRVDFRFFDAGSFGAAQLYFTGSKAHNIELRKLTRKHGWKLNEYGLSKDKQQLAGKTEDAVYNRLKMDWIPPELRENNGEIDAAQNGKLPALIERDDLRGDLHCHTTASDGKLSIRKMAEAAREFGHDYLAITDHSKRVTMANGLDDKRLRKHAEEIRKVDQEMKRFRLLAGIECDILKDGKLDLNEKTLANLDWVVASVHYDRVLSRKAMTERIVKAVSSGVVHCLGHPTGRMIGQRDEMQADWDQIFEACAENGVFVEINSQPDRLDLPDRYLRQAKEAGVRFVISTDAHSPDNFDNLRFGVNVARRGWLEKKDVINTKTITQLRKELS
jgi:DNA polymerase (family X)